MKTTTITHTTTITTIGKHQRQQRRQQLQQPEEGLMVGSGFEGELEDGLDYYGGVSR